MTAEQINGRQARCGCGRTEASSTALAFFEYTGEESDRALTSCKNCAYHQKAHEPEVMARNKALKCTNFQPHGAFQFDSYYCGCRGWD